MPSFTSLQQAEMRRHMNLWHTAVRQTAQVNEEHLIITSSDASLSNICLKLPYPSLSTISQALPDDAELEAEAQPQAARCSCWNVAQLLRSASLLPSYNQ